MTKKEQKTEKKAQTQEESILAKRLASQATIMKKYGGSKEQPDGGRISELSREIKIYPTGIHELDHNVFGIGGIPHGAMIEISGLESSGKSALAMFLAGCVQKYNKTALFKLYDVEDAFVDKWGASMGLDVEGGRVLLPEFWGAEGIADQYHADLADKFPPEIVAIDSLAVLQPQQLMGKNVSDFNMNDNMARARFLTRFFDSIRDGFWFPPKGKDGKLHKDARQIKLGHTSSVLICINHVKPKTKMIGRKSIIEYQTIGGMSLRFHASIRLSVWGMKIEKEGGKIYRRIKIKCVKNKYAPPLKEFELRLNFEGGLERVGTVDYLEMAVKKGLATVKGAWIQSALLPDGKIQGKETFNEFVDTHPDTKAVFIES